MKRILLLLFLIPKLLFSQVVTLDGSSSTDPENGILTFHWALISGPGTVTIANANAKTTTVTATWIIGVYTFEVEVTDPGGLKATDRMIVTVVPNPDIPPSTNAGPDQNVTLPLSKITLTGSATDVNGNGTITSYAWTMISGPNSVVIINSNASVTDVTGIIAGTYFFRLKVTDNGGASSADTVKIIVNPAPANQPPISNAGTDKTITLPVNSVTMNGANSDPGGSVVQVSWAKISGPASFQVVTPSSSTTVIKNLVEGVYLFRQTVTDNLGATAYDEVKITVKKKCSWLAHLFGMC